MFRILAPLYLTLIFGLPTLLTTTAARAILARTPGIVELVLLLAGPIWAVLYGLIAGVLSMPHRHAVVPGTMPRDVSHPLYMHRRLYGLCWTAVYYCTPVYFAWLSIPPLKAVLFRLFGYRASLDFTTYPDTWIRDLPVLDLGRGAYLSNRATIGTNIVMMNGDILVDRITLGDGALVGHLAMLAPGVSLGRSVQVGVGVAIGIKSRLEEGVQVGPSCTIEHNVVLGANVRVGTESYVGSGSRIGPGVHIPPGSVVPPKTFAETQDELIATLQPRFTHASPKIAPASSNVSNVRCD
jgi:carbonic anhydrase/acetyltransferase-like protein (isoleucine patch superfamily)